MAGAASARWDAARRLYEGEAASVELLATLTGLKVRSLHEKARTEGWRARRGRDSAHARLRPLLDRLIRQAEALGTDEAGAKAVEFAALPALLKTIQLLADMTGTADDRAERTKENDERLATILGRVDDRIVELAHAHAEELLRGGWRGEIGEANDKEGG